MARMRKNAVAFSSYITQDLKNIMEFLIEREEITKVVFIRKAVRYFLSGDRIIDKRVIGQNKIFYFIQETTIHTESQIVYNAKNGKIE